MNEEQIERLLDALERIAGSLDRLTMDREEMNDELLTGPDLACIPLLVRVAATIEDALPGK